MAGLIKEALQYIVDLREPKIYTVEGKSFSDAELHQVRANHYQRQRITVPSLNALASIIKGELSDYPDQKPRLFVLINDYKTVNVFTRADEEECRMNPYKAECTDTEFNPGWRDQYNAITELKSRFIPTDDSAYLLNLLSRVQKENGVTSEDNGISQSVVVRQGVALLGSEPVKQFLNLKPFRTFREIPQPESTFILRLDDDCNVALYEADGGVWKMQARDNIATYLEGALKDEVKNGSVVILN